MKIFNFSLFLKKHHPFNFIINIIFIFIILIIFYLGNYEDKFDLLYKDFLTEKKYKLRENEIDKDFIIIEIDDKSFNYLAKSFGSIRISIAKLLHAIKETEPKCAIVNFLFYGKGLSVEDIYLTAATNAKFPVFFKAELTEDGDYLTPIDSYSTLDPKFGFFKPTLSSDKIVRKTILKSLINNYGNEYDLSYKIAHLLDSVSTEKNKLLYNKLNMKSFGAKIQIPIQFTLTNKNIQSINAISLIEEKLSPDTFKDKVIIIDGTASVYQNKISTPLGILPESIVLINSIKTLLNPDKKYELNNFVKLFIIFYTALLFFIINYRGSFLVFIISSIIGISSSLIIMQELFFKGITLPFGSIILAIILPGIYLWILKYIFLTIQSNKLIKLASIDTLTGLYTFKYFLFLLQRDFIRQKRKKNGYLLIIGIEFFEKENLKILNLSEIKSSFMRTFGTCIKNFNSKTKIYGLNMETNHCYLAIRKINPLKTTECLEKLRQSILSIIMEDNLPYDIRLAYTDIKTCNTSSSFSLIQIIQNMLKQKINPNQKIITYKQSALTKSSPDESFDTITDDELSYLTTQIHEDRKDLELMKQRLSQSVTEYTMAQKLTAMGQLSSYYAHELKNPLNNLMNCFEILDDKNETNEEKEEIKKIMKKELKRMIDLSKNMGSHFKPSNEKPEEADLNEIISTTLKFLSRKFSSSNIDVIEELDNSMPHLFLIPDQIKQVLLNLFINAVEAMPKGGHLMVCSYYMPPIAKITVTDTGCGIQPIDLERIFEAFYTTKKQEGTGLGLFACYNIIQHHGGKLKAESTPQKGTTFEIILPT